MQDLRWSSEFLDQLIIFFPFCRYRAMNGGKFPPAYAAMKEVGGGYYNVKKIVQEMQYNAKMPVDKDSVVKEVSARKAAIRKDKSNEVKLQLSSATCLEHECEDTSSIGEAEAKLQTPIAAEQMLLHEISRVSGSVSMLETCFLQDSGF